MKIAKDKWRHFYAGIVLGAMLQAFFSFLLDEQQGLSVGLAVFFSAAVGYGFELFSKFTGKGHYDFMDAVATLIGAVLGIGIVFLLQIF